MYASPMIDQRSKTDSADVVIWIASSVLAFVLGAGSSSLLWYRTHQAADALLLGLAVGGLTLGLACIAASLRTRLSQAVVVVFALALAIGYFVLAPALIHSA